MEKDEIREVALAVADELKSAQDEIYNEVKTKQEELKEKLNILEEKAASNESLGDIQGRVNDSTEELKQLSEKMVELQRKAANEGATEDAAAVIAEAKGFDGTFAEVTAKGAVEFKDITTSSYPSVTLPTGVRVDRQGLVPPIEQPLMLRQLLPVAFTESAAWQYEQELGYTNNAAVVAEGAEKPQSELTFKTVQGNIKKIAHYFRTTDEALDDVPRLEGYIRNRGIYGLLLKEEEQLLVGDNSDDPGQLDGLLNGATAYNKDLLGTEAKHQPVNAMDDILIAISQVQDAKLQADVVVMNHLDVAALRILKDGDGKYLHPAFTGNGAWGLPLVPSFSMPKGDFMVAGLRANVTLLQRKGITVARSTEDRDNFTTNRVTILIEERLQLEKVRPEAIVTGSLTA